MDADTRTALDEIIERQDALEKSLKARRDELAPIIEYVNTRMDSERERNEMVKELRIRLTGDGIRGVIIGSLVLMGWGIAHWLDRISGG